MLITIFIYLFIYFYFLYNFNATYKVHSGWTNSSDKANMKVRPGKKEKRKINK